VSANLGGGVRRSGNSASVGREGTSDLCGSRLVRRSTGGRNCPVRPVMPGFEGRLDEGRQRERLLRSSGTAVPVAAEAAPGRAGIPAPHHLAHRVTAPAALAAQHRQTEAEPAQHHQLSLPIVPCLIVHFVLLRELVMCLILRESCESPVKPRRVPCGGVAATDSCQTEQRRCPARVRSRWRWDPETILPPAPARLGPLREGLTRSQTTLPSKGWIRSGK